MDISVMNTSFQFENTIDIYDSLIWSERYYKYGDFEIVLPLTDKNLNAFRLERYLHNKYSEVVMIVEKMEITTDAENGNKIKVSGRSLESILDRRIIWGLQTLTGSFQLGIKSIIDKAFINPSDGNRRIPNFRFDLSTDPAITDLKIDCQFTGDNVYTVISNLCKEKNVGFKILLDENNAFVFSLYAGIDRSYEQSKNVHVTFAPSFDNLLSSKYTENCDWIKNVTLIGGEGEGNERKYSTYGSGSGLTRREYFTDARDIQSKTEDDRELSAEEYNTLLANRGKQKLEELVKKPSFDCEIETRMMYKPNVDFFKGDIVQIDNGFGQKGSVRIMEMIISDDGSGMTMYPNFEVLD